MYRLTKDVSLSDLRKYGFRPARELPEFDNWCCNTYWYDDWYMISVDTEFPGKPYYADDDNCTLLWEIHIMPVNSGQGDVYYRVWIDMSPSCTCHNDNQDCEVMFYTLLQMIKDGVIEDDWEGV
jgi:hypothetical protein